MLRIKGTSREGLCAYVARQLANFFPDEQANAPSAILAHIDETLNRLEICLSAIRPYPRGEFDYLHGSQYATFLYFLSNTIWHHNGDTTTCTKLFLLNRALNGIDLYYDVSLPKVFAIGHTNGIVFSRKAIYGEYLVISHGCTIGQNHGQVPTLEDGVIMFNHSTIAGNCRIGAGTIISRGVGIISQDTPGNCIAYSGSEGRLIFKPPGINRLEEFFHL